MCLRYGEIFNDNVTTTLLQSLKVKEFKNCSETGEIMDMSL